MKAIKKEIAFILVVALLVGNFSVSFADGRISDEARACVTLGMLNGDSDYGVTPEYLESVALRYQAFVIFLRLKGVEDDFNAFDYVGKPTFSDANGKSAYIQRVLAYAKAHPELGWIGSNGRFNPMSEITSKEYSKVLVEALGYKNNEDYTWNNLELLAKKIGLSTPTGKFKVDNIAALTIDTLNAKTKAGKVLIDALAEEDESFAKKAVEAGFTLASPANLGIVSITAPNARQVKIAFNKEINEASIKADHVKIYINGSSVVIPWTQLVEGKCVIFGLAGTISQNSDVMVFVKNIEAQTDSADKLVASTTTVKMNDSVAPSISNVISTTSKTFVIHSSEPLMHVYGTETFHMLTTILIDGVKLVARITPSNAEGTAVVELGSKLSVGNHSIVIEGYKDLVGLLAPKYQGVLTVLEDKATANIIAVEMLSRTSFKLVFDEPVATLGTIIIDGISTTGSIAAVDKRSYTVTLGSPLGVASLIKSTVSYSGTVDMEGNAVSDGYKSFVFVSPDDTIMPTAALTFKTDNRLQIAYSELMSSPGKVTIKDSKGTTVLSGAVPYQDLIGDPSGKTYLVLTNITVAGSYSIELTDARDDAIRTNQMVSTIIVLSSYDVTPPRITDVILKTVYTHGPPTVYGEATIYFSEIMDITSLMDMRNYLIDVDGSGSSSQLSSFTNAAVTVAPDYKSATLTIPSSSFMAGSGAGSGVTNIYVLAVKDASGMLLSSVDYNTAKFVKSSASSLMATNIEAIETNKLRVTFSNTMAVIDPSEFRLYQSDGITITQIGVAYELDSTGKIVTITLNGHLTTDAKAESIQPTTAKLVIGTTSTKDVFGGTVIGGVKVPAVSVNTPAYVVIADKISPSVTTVATSTMDNAIDITFSEEVNAVSEGALTADLIIKDVEGNVQAPTYTFTGSAATIVDFKKITVTIAGSAGKTYSVELIPRNIKDTDTQNTVKALSVISVVAK